MHSSTSSSNTGRPRSRGLRPIIVLLALVIAFFACVEIGSRVALTRLSRIETRVASEYAAAVEVRPKATNHSLICLGNSLMGEGVDFQALRDGLSPEWSARRLLVESSGYYDFYYGMRRLYADGSRPDAFAVFLGVDQLTLPPAVRRDYFAYRLMDVSDLFNVARDLDLDRTSTSGLFFARMSAFYGMRTEIRKQVLAKFSPRFTDLMKSLTVAPAMEMSDDEIYRVAVGRLRRYRELEESLKTRIILVVPPRMRSGGVSATERAAANAGIAVVNVMPPVTGPADFGDGYHLNADGARKFTTALIPRLKQALAAR